MTLVLELVRYQDRKPPDHLNETLIVSKGDSLKEDVDFIIGRHSSCDFQLDTPVFPGFLSRSHAKVTHSKENKVYVTDLKSLNGTLVNDIMLEPMLKTELKIGDTVTFGCFSPDVIFTPGTTVVQDKTPFKYKLLYKGEPLLDKDTTNKHYINNEHIPSIACITCEDVPLPSKSPTPHSPDSMDSDSNAKDESDVDSGIVCNTTMKISSHLCDKEISKLHKSPRGVVCEAENCRNNNTAMNKDKILPLTVANLLAFSGCHFDNISFSSDEKENQEMETGCSNNEKTLTQPKVKMKRTGKRKRRGIFTKKKRSRNDLEDCCASFECKMKNTSKKTSNMVSWVQCDYCDKWYHTDCVGCDYNIVKLKARKFQCGVC